MTLFQADWKDGRLIISKSPFYWGLDARFFYRIQQGRKWDSKAERSQVLQTSPGMARLGGKDMLISYFLYAFTGVQGQDVSLNKRHFGLTFQAEVQGSLRQAIMYRQCPCSEQKQWVEKVKVKETDSTYSQILFFPVTVSQPTLLEADLYGLKKDIRGREHVCRTHVLTWLL